MRRWLVLIPAFVLAILLPVAGPAHAGRPKPKPTRKPPARMLVYTQEWSVWSSRGSVPAGGVSVQLWNRGQDAHDLRVARLGAHGALGHVLGAVRKTGSGGITSASWHLRAGVYELYCSLPGHRAHGMHARLVVR